MQRPRGKTHLVLVDINEKSSVDGAKSGRQGEWQNSGWRVGLGLG